LQNNSKKPASKFGIRLPQIPKPLPPAELTGLDDQETYSQVLFADLDFSTSQHGALAFDQSLFRRVNFMQTRAASIRLSDCRLEMCDLSAAVWMGARFRRVEVSGCRLLGTALAEATLEDASFKDCLAERMNFTWTVFKGARFEKCDLREAAFLGADLRGVVFRQCDLSRADLRDANLNGADLRDATLDGLKVGIKDLVGAIMTPVQGLQVMGLLGIQIKPLDEE